jgi:tetratricopeptide (TPR) repeat protein
MWFASLRAAEGEIDNAIELYEKSKEINPLGRIPYANLPGMYAMLGKNNEALRLLVQATELHPDWDTPYQTMGIQLASLGRIDESLAWLQSAVEFSGNEWMTAAFAAGIYMTFGEYDRVQAVIDAIPESHPLLDYAGGLSLLISNDADGALEFMLNVVAEKTDEPLYIFGMIAGIAMYAGNLDVAEEYTLLSDPRLTSDSDLIIDRSTLQSVIQLAYIEKQRGNVQEAHDKLVSALPFVQDQPRLGIGGLGITDVQIYALLGRVEDAVAAFRDAVAEGYRGSIPFTVVPTADDPFLASIKDDQRFVAILAGMNADVERMRENAVKAEADSSWDALRQVVVDAVKADVVSGLKSAIP